MSIKIYSLLTRKTTIPLLASGILSLNAMATNNVTEKLPQQEQVVKTDEFIHSEGENRTSIEFDQSEQKEQDDIDYGYEMGAYIAIGLLAYFSLGKLKNKFFNPKTKPLKSFKTK